MTINKARGCLYFLARLLGDVNAVQRGRVRKRVERRVVGRFVGRWLRKIVK